VIGGTIVLAAFLVLSGCEQVADIFGTLTRRLEDIRIEDQRITAGATLELTVTGMYSDGSEETINTGLTWSSDSVGVATVTAGTVRGIAVGEATITVTHDAGRNTFDDTAIVTVLPLPFVVDDFESGSIWQSFPDGAGSTVSAPERSAEQAYGGTYSLKVTFSVATSGDNPWGVANVRTITGSPRDFSDYSSVSVKVQPNGANTNVILVLADSDGTQLTSALATEAAPVSGTGWVTVSYDIADLVLAPWSFDDPAVPEPFDLGAVEEFQIILSAGSGTVYFDDIVIE
jgi:hypothetical protein